MVATTSSMGAGTNGLSLRPAEAEPPVADHEALLACGELPRGGLHGERPAAGYDDHRGGAVHLLERTGNVVHHALERLRHVVEGTVREDDRVFQQPIGIDCG
jgi:hypothetical protein